jgi:hypothetical protein
VSKTVLKSLFVEKIAMADLERLGIVPRDPLDPRHALPLEPMRDIGPGLELMARRPARSLPMAGHGSVLAVALLLVLTMSGCAGRSMREDATPPVAEPRVVYQTQIAMGPCVFKRGPEPEFAVLAPIAIALLSSAVTTGVDYVGKALQESAKETNDRVTAVRNVEATNETFGPCLEIARGWFFDTSAPKEAREKALAAAKTTWARAALEGAVDGDTLDLLWERRMWIAAPPDFIFEAEIVPSSAEKPNEQVLTMAPVYARLDAPISQARLRPSRARDVAVFFAFADDAENPSISEAVGSGIVVGRLEPGEALFFELPEPATQNQPNRGPLEAKWFKIAVGQTRTPMTIAALVTEHQDAEPFLQFVADVFGGAQAPITTALQTAVVPTMRAAAKENQQAARERVRTDYEAALSAALAATETCAAGVASPVAAATDVRSKVRSLNAAARASGDREFNEGVVPLSTNASAVQSGCVALRQMLRAAVNA